MATDTRAALNSRTSWSTSGLAYAVKVIPISWQLVVGCVDGLNNHDAEFGSGGVGKFSCSNNSLLF